MAERILSNYKWHKFAIKRHMMEWRQSSTIELMFVSILCCPENFQTHQSIWISLQIYIDIVSYSFRCWYWFKQFALFIWYESTICVSYQIFIDCPSYAVFTSKLRDLGRAAQNDSFFYNPQLEEFFAPFDAFDSKKCHEIEIK